MVRADRPAYRWRISRTRAPIRTPVAVMHVYDGHRASRKAVRAWVISIHRVQRQDMDDTVEELESAGRLFRRVQWMARRLEQSQNLSVCLPVSELVVKASRKYALKQLRQGYSRSSDCGMRLPNTPGPCRGRSMRALAHDLPARSRSTSSTSPSREPTLRGTACDRGEPVHAGHGRIEVH